MSERLWIVGGSGDIGRAVGREFGGRGWTVCLSARTPTRLERAAAALRADGVSTDTLRFDAADRRAGRRSVTEYLETHSAPSVLAYNVAPQALPGIDRLTAYLRHTVGGLSALLDALAGAGALPSHVVVLTSSKARDPGAVSPEYHAAKQALFSFVEAFCVGRETTHSILWLGRRGTEERWRWLRPEEMAARAWESFETREPELLVGDLY